MTPASTNPGADGNENGDFIPVSRFFRHLGMKMAFSFPKQQLGRSIFGLFK
jgi:hypothetical protein